MFPYEAVFSSIISFVSLGYMETETKLPNVVDSWKRRQLLITRDSVSISFNSFANLVCPGEWGQNIKGKKRS